MPPQACLTALVRSCGKRPHSPSKRDGDAEIVGLRENSTSFPLYPSKPSAIAASLSVTRFARQAKHPKSSARTHTHTDTRGHTTQITVNVRVGLQNGRFTACAGTNTWGAWEFGRREQSSALRSRGECWRCCWRGARGGIVDPCSFFLSPSCLPCHIAPAKMLANSRVSHSGHFVWLQLTVRKCLQVSVAQEWHKRDGVVETGTKGTQLRGVGTGGILDKLNLRTFTARLLRAVYCFDWYGCMQSGFPMQMTSRTRNRHPRRRWDFWLLSLGGCSRDLDRRSKRQIAMFGQI